MASDLLFGLTIGLVVFGLANPLRGLVWIILEQKKQIRFLSGKIEHEKKHFWQK